MPRLQKNVWEKICAEYSDGATSITLENKYQVSRSSILYQIRKRGIEIRDYVELNLRKIRKTWLNGKKQCSACLLHKDPSDFSKDLSRADKLHHLCRECLTERERKRRASWTPEQKKKVNEINKRYRQRRVLDEYSKHRMYLDSWRHSRTPNGRFCNNRSRCLRRGMPWTIEKEDYFKLLKQLCAYCGGELPVAGVGLDRLNNEKGYELDNVLPCCTICNLSRRNHFTVEEMKKFIGPAIYSIREARAKSWRSIDETQYKKGDVLRGKVGGL